MQSLDFIVFILSVLFSVRFGFAGKLVKKKTLSYSAQ